MTSTQLMVTRRAGKHRREDDRLFNDLAAFSKAAGASQSSIIRDAVREFIDKALRDNAGIKARFDELRPSTLRVIK